MFAWLNELYELTQLTPANLPWDSVSIITREYTNLLDYYKHHYDMQLTIDGWIGIPKPDWNVRCETCNGLYAVDGKQCRSCADGA